MKAIFLDIDGVVCMSKDACGPDNWLPALEREAVILVDHLCQIDEAITRVVISSSWRLMFSKEMLTDYLEKHGLNARFVHQDWRTLAINNGSRGIEIQEWLGRHPEVADDFLIIDDRPSCDFLPNHQTRHVRTVSECGFRLEEFSKACSILHGLTRTLPT